MLMYSVEGHLNSWSEIKFHFDKLNVNNNAF